jgi:hypothetical protein
VRTEELEKNLLSALEYWGNLWPVPLTYSQSLCSKLGAGRALNLEEKQQALGETG